MPVVVVCPGCRQRFRVPDGRQGTSGRCPKCGTAISFATSRSDVAVAAPGAPDLSLGDRATRGTGSAAADPGGLPEGVEVAERYTLGARLGRGGMGVVYRAEDSRPRRPVALKFLATPGGAEDAAVARFLQEAETIARLNHQHIIQVYEVGEWEHDGRALRYIAMELVGGGSLRDLVRERGKLPVPEASALMQQVGQALSHAHRQGVIHRDLKPANVLLTKDGIPKLADFGLAKGATASELSVAGHAMGTLGFMSPEQRQDAKSVDHRTDIYAWGATFYQLVTGKDPLAWDPDEIPHEVSAVIRKCLKDREARYFSMEEAVTSLETAMVHRATPQRSAAPANGARVCQECRAEVQPGLRYCQACGTTQIRMCPTCKAEIPQDSLFCGNCGARSSAEDARATPERLGASPPRREREPGKGQPSPIRTGLAAAEPPSQAPRLETRPHRPALAPPPRRGTGARQIALALAILVGMVVAVAVLSGRRGTPGESLRLGSPEWRMRRDEAVRAISDREEAERRARDAQTRRESEAVEAQRVNTLTRVKEQVHSLLERAEQALRAQRFADALAAAEEALGLDPENSAARSSAIAARRGEHVRSLLVRSKEALRAERFADALAAAEEVLGLHPENFEARLLVNDAREALAEEARARH